MGQRFIRIPITSGNCDCNCPPVISDCCCQCLGYCLLVTITGWGTGYIYAVPGDNDAVTHWEGYIANSECPPKLLKVSLRCDCDMYGCDTLPRCADVKVLLDAVSQPAPPYRTAETTYSWSHTVAGGDRYLLVAVSLFDAAAEDVDSVTWNATPLTRITFPADNNEPHRAELWGLVAPETGTFDIEVTLTAAVDSVAGAMSFINVDQDAAVVTFADSEGAGNPASIDLTLADDTPFLVNSIAVADTLVTTAINEIFNTPKDANATPEIGSGAAAWRRPAAAGVTTMEWNGVADGARWTMAGVALAPTERPGCGWHVMLEGTWQRPPEDTGEYLPTDPTFATDWECADVQSCFGVEHTVVDGSSTYEIAISTAPADTDCCAGSCCDAIQGLSTLHLFIETDVGSVELELSSGVGGFPGWRSGPFELPCVPRSELGGPYTLHEFDYAQVYCLDGVWQIFLFSPTGCEGGPGCASAWTCDPFIVEFTGVEFGLCIDVNGCGGTFNAILTE